MVFKGHIPGSAMGQKKRNLFNVKQATADVAGKKLKEEEPTLQEKNPRLFAYKLNVMAEIESQAKIERNVRKEHAKQLKYTKDTREDPNLEITMKTAVTNLDIRIDDARLALADLKAQIVIKDNKLKTTAEK